MCRKYTVHRQELTLSQVIDRIESKPRALPPKVVYSQQEIVSAAKVLERLAAMNLAPPVARKAYG